ncbi:hypothetical protein ACQ1PQ_11010, partial [Ornithobacterium rhinotracheale]
EILSPFAGYFVTRAVPSTCKLSVGLFVFTPSFPCCWAKARLPNDSISAKNRFLFIKISFFVKKIVFFFAKIVKNI